MRSLLVVLALLAAPLAAQDDSSQDDVPYAPGSVVTVDGDTLRGEIALVPDFVKARGVTFRATPDDTPTTLTHRDAQSYQVEGGSRFVYRWVYFNPDSSRGAHVFLRELVRGPRTLYALHVTVDADSFYVEGADFPVEGLFEYRTKLGATRSRLVKPWVGTLNRAFQACRPLLDDVAEAEYRERAFTELVLGYNECVDPEYRPEPLANRVDRQSGYAVHFSLEAAGGIVSLERSASVNLDSADDDGMTTVSLRGVMLVEFQAWPSTFYGAIELGLQRIGTATVSDNDPSPFGSFDEVEESYAPIGVTLGLGFQYDAPLRPLTPFLRGTYVLGWTPFGDRNLSFNTEVTAYGGYALTGGVLYELPTGLHLSFGARAEFLSASEDFIYVPLGSKLANHNTVSGVLGVRF
ncbi:MAG: hypothetical protein AAGF99_10105 [Bacteroidota bacterium]